MATSESGKPGEEKEEVASPKRITRFVRLLSVAGYMIAVSSAGVMMSLYYIFLWDPYSADGPSALALAAEPHQLLRSGLLGQGDNRPA